VFGIPSRIIDNFTGCSMANKRRVPHRTNLEKKYPPSEACACAVCLAYCQRPGWWTVTQAAQALQAGYGRFIMLEIAPECNQAVLSPALRGCEGGPAMQAFANAGCIFQQADQRCQLHGTPFLPLECSFCHHERVGLGAQCHADLETDWRSDAGRRLVRRWCRQIGLWDFLDIYRLGWLKR